MKKSPHDSCFPATQFSSPEVAASVSGCLHILEINVLCVSKHAHARLHVHTHKCTCSDRGKISLTLPSLLFAVFDNLLLVASCWLSFYSSVYMPVFFILSTIAVSSLLLCKGDIRNPAHPLLLPSSSSHFLATILFLLYCQA